MNITRSSIKLLVFAIFILIYSFSSFSQNAPYFSFTYGNGEKESYAFTYEHGNSVIVSGHRGTKEPGYPENSIEGFEYVLSLSPAFFEIDPRLTKDSVIVLMHDETLDRTTTGTGKLSDYTFAEIQKLYLKDSQGNVTHHKIPTLEEVIRWSKGKTIINLDKKDVPLHMTADLIKKLNAEGHVMVTVHTGAQARFYYDRLPSIKMSAFMRNAKELEDMAISGVPWSLFIAYVGQNIDEKNANIVQFLHDKGVRCMVSYAPSLDRLPSKSERSAAYKTAFGEKPNIIESDYPNDVHKLLP